jgi:hypothetical protein
MEWKAVVMLSVIIVDKYMNDFSTIVKYFHHFDNSGILKKTVAVQHQFQFSYNYLKYNKIKQYRFLSL